MIGEDIRAAAAWLDRKGIKGKGITARALAGASEEYGKDFDETLRLLATMLAGEQGVGASPETEATVR